MSDASERHALANWMRVPKLCMHKSSGSSKPSQRHLTSDGIAKLQVAVAQGLCHGKAAVLFHAADSVQDASLLDAALALGLCHGEFPQCQPEFEHWFTRFNCFAT